MRALVIGAVLFGACTTSPSSAVTPTPSSAPTVTFAATSTPAVTRTTFPTPTFVVEATAQWPVLLYEGEGFIVSQRTESAKREVARPCGPISRLEARPAGILVWCSSSPEAAELRLVSVPDGRVTVLASAIQPWSWPADISPDGRSVAAFRRGSCAGPAPVCQARAVLIDVTTKSEREILSSGYPLGATLQWTALGLTLFQPECAEAGCAGIGEKGGTFVWDGTEFKRWSDLRFVARSGDWTLLERLRSLSDRSDPRTVIVRGPQGEKELSAGRALAISESGETLVWMPGAEQLMRFAPDGRVLWQASFPGEVLKVIGTDVLIGAPTSGNVELYDLRRMLRFVPTTPIPSAVAGVAR
jgi:hypothetical protein